MEIYKITIGKINSIIKIIYDIIILNPSIKSKVTEFNEDIYREAAIMTIKYEPRNPANKISNSNLFFNFFTPKRIFYFNVNVDYINTY